MNNNLSKCVAALNDVRRIAQNETDPRVMAALTAVIADLERCVGSEDPNQPELTEVAGRALAVIGDILTCLSGIAELVHYFRT